MYKEGILAIRFEGLSTVEKSGIARYIYKRLYTEEKILSGDEGQAPGVENSGEEINETPEADGGKLNGN